MENEAMKLVFTSFRDSLGWPGLKVSLDRHPPKLCSYATLSYLAISVDRTLSLANAEQICKMILDSNWLLTQDFISDIYALGLRQIIFCDWATKEQIAHGRFCAATTVGKYILDRSKEFEFPIELEYRDGREL